MVIVLMGEQELLRRVEQLTEDCRQAKFDHARESHFNREVQLREVQLHDELKKYRSVMVGISTISPDTLPANGLYLCTNEVDPD